jgi:hypothetical protein
VILKLEVPFLNAAIRGGTVTWHKREGDQISYGEPVCDLVVEEKLALRKTSRALRLARVARSRRSANERVEWSRGKMLVRYRLTSSESLPATLRRIVAQDGQPVQVGDLLAVAATGADEPLGEGAGEWAEIPSARLVADVLEEAEA